MTKTVVVRGQTFELAIEQKSKAVWKATGAYRGKLLQWEGRTANAAASRWREHAHYSTL